VLKKLAFLVLALPAPAQQTYSLVFSTSSNRSAPAPLDGATVGSDIYVFTTPDAGVRRVSFFLDNPSMQGSATRVESGAPFDFRGGSAATATPFATSGVSDGPHSIAARLELTGGGVTTALANFVVDNDAPPTQGDFAIYYSLQSNRSGPVELDGADVEDDIYVFTQPVAGVTRVQFFIDDPTFLRPPHRTESGAPFDLMGGTAAAAQRFDTGAIPDGNHTISARITHTGGQSLVHAPFEVSNNQPVPALAFSPAQVALSLAPGAEDTFQVGLATNPGPSTDYTLLISQPWLTLVSPQPPTPATLTFEVDSTGLAAGNHSATVTASRSGYVSAQLQVSLDVVAAAPPDLIYLAWVGDPSTTMTIVWRTASSSTPSIAEYRVAGEAGWTQATGNLRPSGAPGTLHQVDLTGLMPSTSYEYRVMGEGGAFSPVQTTRTAPPLGPGSFTGVYVADTGLIGRLDGLATGTEQVIDEIALLDPHIILPGGDYAYFNSDHRFATLDLAIDAWFAQMQPIFARTPVLPTYGNHEVLLGESYDAWAQRFPTPAGFDGRRTYSFTVGDVHFISVFAVANFSGLRSGTLSWLAADMQAARDAGARWIIPFFHASPLTDGTSHPANMALLAELGPLFEQFGVEVAISSHDQSFERSYPLVDVPATNTPTSLGLRCYDDDDGTVWLKVSPGGKLSNSNGSFSNFMSDPAPAWTATRNNTLHHFLHFVVSAAGSIRFDTYGVVGNGAPPALVDTFTYQIGTCPAEFVYSQHSVRLTSLDGGNDMESVSLSTSDSSDASFSLLSSAPWLAATPTSGDTPAAIQVTADSTMTLPGSQAASLVASTGGLISGNLLVHYEVYGLLTSNNPDRSSPLRVQGSTVSGNIYAFMASEYDVDRVRFFIDDPTFSGTPDRNEGNGPFDLAGSNVETGTALPFDTTALRDGVHTLSADIDFLSGGSAELHSTFVVNNAGSPRLAFNPDQVSFALQADETDQDSVSLSTTNLGAASFTLQSSASWLSTTMSQGTTPATVVLLVDSTGLAAGTHNATLTASASGFENDTLDVSLVVGSAQTYQLLISATSNRASPQPLDQATLTGNVYVFTGPDTFVQRVRFYIDDPDRSGPPHRTENSGPFDLQGGTAANASPYNTAQLANGPHTITASLELAGGGLEVVHAAVTVSN
jgi:hypothetical protein